MNYDLEDYYPQWLKQGVIDRSFPWEKARVTSMARFLQEYTLHDSYWIDFSLDPTREALLIVRWDSFWSEERIPYPDDQVASWPILLIRFPKLYLMLRSEIYEGAYLGESGISGANSRLLDGKERESIQDFALSYIEQPGKRFLMRPPDPTMCHTTILDHAQGQIDLFHGEEVQLLCLSQAGEVLPIPDL